MSAKRSTMPVVVVAVAVVAILAFLYGMPSGRMARRETLRAVRLAGNATGIYPLPVLTVKLWDGNRERALLVELYGSGRLVVSGARSIERQLAPDVADRILEGGKAALGDFNSDGCQTERGGLCSELYVLIDGRRVGTVCRDSSRQPRGFESKRLFAEIEGHVPGLFSEF